MTERESEQFYDDLRRKLEDYGSAPPESVWAGIRQQVPARRRPWWRGVGLALVLTGIIAYLLINPSLWQPNAARRPTPIRPVTAARTTPAPADRPGSTASTSARSGQASSLRSSPRASEVPAATPLVTATGGSVAQGKSASRLAARVEPRKEKVLESTRRGTPPRLRRRAVALADRPAPNRKEQDIAAVNAPARVGLVAMPTPAGAPKQRRRRPERIVVAAVARCRTMGKAWEKPFAATERSAVTPAPTAPATSSQPLASSAAGPLRPESADYAAAQRQTPASLKPGNDPLPWLSVPLQLPAVPAPVLRYAARPEQPARRATVGNWEIFVGAGPALSYRRLGGNARPVEQLERPAAGYGAQLEVARALNPRLRLAAGLGYLEVAAGLNLRVRKAAPDSLGPASIRAVSFRDYYRFLTVPVAAQYQLGATQRWRFGLLGGAAPALLLRARTTEGGACNCQQQAWQPGDSTRFRRLALTLTAGGFVGYQAAPGVWLTLRPQAQYFPHSSPDPPAGRAPRQPWNVGVQGGISLDLPFKR